MRTTVLTMIHINIFIDVYAYNEKILQSGPKDCEFSKWPVSIKQHCEQVDIVHPFFVAIRSW